MTSEAGSAAGASLVGHVVDSKYLIERPLGEGGMGSVFRARHLGTERPVALKVIAPHLVASAEAMERFRAEAIAAGRLRHPNVVDVTDFGVVPVDGRSVAYLVMELLEGQTLASLISVQERLPLSFAVDVIEQVCSAMEEAHKNGIVHRDLKPENVWLEPNRRGGYTVKVLDFGIAKLAEIQVPTTPAIAPSGSAGGIPPAKDDDLPATRPLDRAELGFRTPTPVTEAGAIIGTPESMSPEQWRGLPLDGRSDIYSLGVIAYRMLSGRPPFEGALVELMRQHLEREPPPLSGVPAAVGDLIGACLAKLPDYRPGSAAELASALRARAEGIGTLLRRVAALGSEHYPAFFTISAIAHLPMMVVLLATVVMDLIRALLVLPRSLDLPMEIVPYVLFFSTGLFVASFSAGVFVHVLASLTLRPLAAVSPLPLVLSLRPLRYRLLWTALLFYAFSLPSKLCLLLPFIPDARRDLLSILLFTFVGAYNYVRYMLHAEPVMVEGISGFPALRRASDLCARGCRTVRGTLAYLVSLLSFDLMGLVASVIVIRALDVAVEAAFARGSLLIVPVALGVAGFVVISIVCSPMLGLSLAMVYIRIRQADGETIEHILGTAWDAASRQPVEFAKR